MDVIHRRGLRATMPDGVELAADAWHPDGPGPWPVLLQRLPYGRLGPSSPTLPHPLLLAGRGYAVVAQHVRGRGDSAGVFSPFADEAADGVASVEWAAGLPFCDGRVATYGFSYQGLNQVLTAAQRPEALVAIAPMQCAPGPYEGWTYEGGCLKWPFVADWAAQLAGQEPGVAPPPYDVVASLTMVGPQESASMRLTTGARRLAPGPTGRARRTTVAMGPTSWLVPAGWRIRLDLSASRFPAYDRNPQSAAVAVARAGRDDCRAAVIAVADVGLDLPVER